jgi:multiple sugar transport system permease protein
MYTQASYETFQHGRRIIIPLSGPALATLGIFTFMGVWNSFLWPLIVENSENMLPVTVGLSVL